jgi:hypothetical protein
MSLESIVDGSEKKTIHDGTTDHANKQRREVTVVKKHRRGTCVFDSRCAGEMVCFQRDQNETVPGCTGVSDVFV